MSNNFICSIYKWENIGDNCDKGMCYIGQSRDEKNRKKNHLNCKGNSCPSFYEALKEFGAESFNYTVLESIEISEDELIKSNNSWCNEKEKYYIALYDSYNNGYNLTRGGGATSVPIKLLKIKKEYIWNLTLKSIEYYNKNIGHFSCVSENYRIPIIENFDISGFRLGKEIRKYRHFRNRWDEVYYQKLLELGLYETWLESKWNYYYLPAFQYYYKIYNHLNIPQNYIIPNDENLPFYLRNYKLGIVIGLIRSFRINLDEYKINLLYDMKFRYNHWDFLWEFILQPSFDYYYKIYNNLNVKRNFVIPNDIDNKLLQGFTLGEEVHKIRSNNMDYIKKNPERYNWLIKRHWVENSKYAVTKNEIEYTVYNYRWDIVYEPFFNWYYLEYGHINLSQTYSVYTDNKCPQYIKQLFKENIKDKNLDVSSLIPHLKAHLKGLTNTSYLKNNPKRIKFLTDKKLMKDANEFNFHKFILGINYLIKYTNLSHPSQSYKIPHTDKLPKYMIGFSLGTYWANKERLNKDKNNKRWVFELNSKQKFIYIVYRQIIELRKIKASSNESNIIIPTTANYYKEDSEKLENMKKKCKDIWNTDEKKEFARIRNYKKFIVDINIFNTTKGIVYLPKLKLWGIRHYEKITDTKRFTLRFNTENECKEFNIKRNVFRILYWNSQISKYNQKINL